MPRKQTKKNGIRKSKRQIYKKRKYTRRNKHKGGMWSTSKKIISIFSRNFGRSCGSISIETNPPHL